MHLFVQGTKKKKGSRLSATKLRVKKECEYNNIYCWITDGKEIENYLPAGAVSKIYEEKTGIKIDLTINKYDDLESILKSSFKRKWKKSWSYNKTKPSLARKIVQYIKLSDISPELKRHLNQIHNVIIKN